MIICGSYDNYVYAFNEKGDLLWKANCESSPIGGLSGRNNFIYATTAGGFVVAINAVKGKLNWKFKTDGISVYPPVVVEEFLYFSDFNQKLYCLSEKGEKIWEIVTSSPVSKPVVIGNQIFVGGMNSLFYCIDIKERSIDWTFQAGVGNADSIRDKIKGALVSIVEFDKKIFKTWKPETKAAGAFTQTQSPGYGANIPKGFAFGGEMTYGQGNINKLSAYSQKSKYAK